MRSVSNPGLCLNNHRLRAMVKPRNRPRKTHPAGQATVPAARNRARLKTTNVPTISAVSTFRLTLIGHPLQSFVRCSPVHDPSDENPLCQGNQTAKKCLGPWAILRMILHTRESGCGCLNISREFRDFLHLADFDNLIVRGGAALGPFDRFFS